MEYQRVRKSSSWNPLSQEKSSQFAPRPFAVQAQQDSRRPPTQKEIENEAQRMERAKAQPGDRSSLAEFKLRFDRQL
jgi:hypothetical protein